MPLFWSSGILTGNQTNVQMLTSSMRFWSSGILTGNQTGLGTPLTDDQVVYQAKRTMDNTKENLVELIIILKSGDIMHLEK